MSATVTTGAKIPYATLHPFLAKLEPGIWKPADVSAIAMGAYGITLTQETEDLDFHFMLQKQMFVAEVVVAAAIEAFLLRSKAMKETHKVELIRGDLPGRAISVKIVERDQARP
jgi:hypothetical protein